MRDNRKVTSTRWQNSFLLSTLHKMLNLTTTHRQEYLFWESGNPIQKFQHTIGTKNLRIHVLKRVRTVSLLPCSSPKEPNSMPRKKP